MRGCGVWGGVGVGLQGARKHQLQQNRVPQPSKPGSFDPLKMPLTAALLAILRPLLMVGLDRAAAYSSHCPPSS